MREAVRCVVRMVCCPVGGDERSSEAAVGVVAERPVRTTGASVATAGLVVDKWVVDTASVALSEETVSSVWVVVVSVDVSSLSGGLGVPGASFPGSSVRVGNIEVKSGRVAGMKAGGETLL